MYTCSLEGCKSAWGTSDDMFNHVKNVSHQRNYFKKLHHDDDRIMGLTKDKILKMAVDYEEEEGGPGERDYALITRISVAASSIRMFHFNSEFSFLKRSNANTTYSHKCISYVGHYFFLRFIIIGWISWEV